MHSSWDPAVPAMSPPRHHGSGLNPAEGDLIDNALQGRTEAFADLVLPHISALNRLARLRVRCEAEAEDIVQQAVLCAFRHLSQFRREASFKTWLYAITFHEVSQSHRGRVTTGIRSLYETRAVNIPDPSSDPERQCQHSQDVARLRQALRRLPEKYRLIIQMRDLRELSIAETARSLSLTAAVVKIRHHRARKLLLRSLAVSQHVQRTRRGARNG